MPRTDQHIKQVCSGRTYYNGVWSTTNNASGVVNIHPGRLVEHAETYVIICGICNRWCETISRTLSACCGWRASHIGQAACSRVTFCTICPACSRVCPEAAIIFPKYKKGPINGDVVREQDIQREAMKVDISTLLGGDLYGSLRTRQRDARKRFSTERDESKALLERKRCLGKLRKDLDIPDEVLMTLPSAEDIEERAARAKAKLAKRQAMSQTVKDTRPAPSETEWGI